MTHEKRLALLEAKAAAKKPGRTAQQELTAERLVACLLRGIPIPQRLRAEARELPPEEPLSPALARMIEDVYSSCAEMK